MVVDMDGYGRIPRMMRQFRRRAKFVAPLTFDDAADAVVRQNRMVFALEGAFGGKRWAPLSPRYAAWKVRMVGNRPILVFSDQLRESLTERPMGVEVLGTDFYEFGTDDRTAKWHQEGTRGGMPARPPVTATEWLNGELARLVGSAITEGE